ncbi:MAG: hypothetical protein ACKO27_07665 [Ilumatobacteraceae bacterium]
MKRARRAGAVMVSAASALMLVAGCSLRVSTGALETVPTVASTAPVSGPALALPTSTSTSATIGETAFDEAPVTLSPDGPWRRVSGAPGIDTPGLFYELMPKLYVYLPTVEDLDRGITWTLGLDDVPIIEAYLQALLVYYRATTVNPMELDDPGWERWFVDAGAVLLDGLGRRRDRGEHVDLADGVVLRPLVAGDERSETTALVMDCMLDGSVFLTPDGSLAEGSRWGVGKLGFGMRLEAFDGRWMAKQTGPAEQACIGF